jgi:replicative DNA helicase
LTMDREPPHNLEAELALIGAELLYGGRVLEQAGLGCDEFYLPAHREAWKAMGDVAARNIVPDIVMVGAELKANGLQNRFEGGWETWAINAANVAAQEATVPHYAKLVRELAGSRKLISLCAEVMAAGYGGRPFEEMMTTWRTEGAKLENLGGAHSYIHVSDAIKRCLDQAQLKASGKAPPSISTGHAELDKVIDGLEPGQLCIIAARPAVGKSSLAGNIAACNAIRGIPTWFGSVEMSDVQLARRWLAWEAKVGANKIKRGALTYDDWKRLTAAAGTFEKSQLSINDQALTLDALVGDCRAWHAHCVRGRKDERGNPDMRGLGVIDYAQRVEVKGRKGENREQEVARVAMTSKGLAKSLRIPMILVCQLGRAIEKRGGPPVMSDLRESGALEQEADIIIFIHRDMAEVVDSNGHVKAQFIIGKNREGPIGTAESDYIPELTMFVSAMGEEEAASYEATGGPEHPTHWSDTE